MHAFTNYFFYRHCLTIHLYYLQLRQFLLSGYIQCPDDILINLTSYALQAEYGDFLPQYQGVEYFKKEFYIPGKVPDTCLTWFEWISFHYVQLVVLMVLYMMTDGLEYRLPL